MVNVEISVEAATDDGLHDLVHIRISILKEGLLEVRKLSADITEVNDRELIGFHELFDILIEVTEAVRLQPAANAHLHREVWAVAGKLKGATIAIRIPYETGYTTGLRNRRIVRMKRQLHIGFFTYWKCLIQEIFEVIPDFLLSVYTVV